MTPGEIPPKTGSRDDGADDAEAKLHYAKLTLADRLLGWPVGRFWPVAAALLPPLIPIVRGLQAGDGQPGLSPYIVREVTVVILAAVALLQSYGQARAERYRNDSDSRIGRISTGIERISTGIEHISAGIEQQAVELRRIADGTRSIATYLNKGRKASKLWPGRSYTRSPTSEQEET